MAHVRDWRGNAIVISVLVSLVVLFGKRVHQLFPGVLLAIIAAILYSRFAGYNGAELGSIHAGLPPITHALALSKVPRLLVPAFVIALLGFAEASSIARTYAALERKRWDPNREFVSQGVANLGAGMFGGFPVGASFSRSALNKLAGAKTNMSALVTGLAVLAFLPLGFLLSPLPQSVLATTVIIAVAPLIRMQRIIGVAKLSRVQFALTLTAFALTLALAPDVEWAILAAVGLSVRIHLWRELRIDLTATSYGTELELAPEGVLWFGTARSLEDRFLQLCPNTPKPSGFSCASISWTNRPHRRSRLKALVDDARGADLTVTIAGSPGHASGLLLRVFREDAS